LNTAGTLALIQDVRKQVSEGLFNDKFMALASASDERKTATEVLEIVSEGLRLLGPVLERLQFEKLDPEIDRIFSILLQKNFFPEVPVELEGVNLTTEYISPLAQAQKAVGTDSITRLIQVIQAVSSLDPDSLDNIDWDRMIALYSDLIGVSPTILNSADEIAEIRELRAQREAALLNQQQENQNVDNLKKMSETQVTPDENAIQSSAAAET
jgi:hypothetical protein